MSAKFGLIYAGAQKNIGPAGLAIVIVREDLVGLGEPTPPAMLDYATHVKARSMYNTPPTYAVYVAGLVFQWLLETGGLAAAEQRNIAKAALLYDFIDSSDFYINPVEKADRSRMNVPFRLADPDLEADFLAGAAKHDLVELKGHRSVGGMRASLYNAMPIEGVQALVDYMAEFAARRAESAVTEKYPSTVLNHISAGGLKRLPWDRFAVSADVDDPHADPGPLGRPARHGRFRSRCWRSAAPASGTNNIPIARMSARGIPVFNAPGANANAVKELVVAGMLLAARNIDDALKYLDSLDPDDPELEQKVEAGKKAFAGYELAGQTLGIVGLGKIGCLVADAAIKLGMHVIGYDPEITVDSAWSLPATVKKAHSLARCSSTATSSHCTCRWSMRPAG